MDIPTYNLPDLGNSVVVRSYYTVYLELAR